MQLRAKISYQNRELLKAANLLPLNATSKDIDNITKEKITPMLADHKGNTFTFKEKNLDYENFLHGEQNSPLKLFYKIKDGGVIIPLKGFGLWDAIYGYIALDKNGYQLLGISWYDQKETPGLGAEIQNNEWQKQFKGKNLFHGPKMESFGIDFVPKQMLKSLPPSKKQYTVDAITGATITTNGVQSAIKTSLAPYIPLLKGMQKQP
jgi:Na+-transporting NADH:ubiquinone oxidoreductase subunit C